MDRESHSDRPGPAAAMCVSFPLCAESSGGGGRSRGRSAIRWAAKRSQMD
jgi:hypothetical protein